MMTLKKITEYLIRTVLNLCNIIFAFPRLFNHVKYKESSFRLIQYNVGHYLKACDNIWLITSLQ